MYFQTEFSTGDRDQVIDTASDFTSYRFMENVKRVLASYPPYSYWILIQIRRDTMEAVILLALRIIERLEPRRL